MKKIMRAQLTKRLSKLEPPPRDGWIKLIRQALGMSTRQLAKRLQVSQSRVSQIEKNEANQTLSLKALNEAAEALNCRLCYTFIPKKDLEILVRDQAEEKAKALLKKVAHTMELELQGTSTKLQKLVFEETVEAILKKPHLLWNKDEI